jgi:hypothetical protein
LVGVASAFHSVDLPLNVAILVEVSLQYLKPQVNINFKKAGAPCRVLHPNSKYKVDRATLNNVLLL